MSNTSMTRRDVLKGAGAAAVAAAVPATALADAAQEVAWDEEYDVIVIGAGIAGRTAAVTVATEGEGATCLLADKVEGFSGNTPFSNGAVVYGEDPEAFFAYMKELAGEDATTPDDVLKAYADGACTLFSWLYDDLGANLEETRIMLPHTADDPDGNPVSEYPELEHSWVMGKFYLGQSKEVEVQGPKHIYEFLGQVIEEHSDTVTYREGETGTATELIRNAEGRVEGAVIGGLKVRASRGVIMCCGGFESDPVMMQNYLGAGRAVPGAGIGNTGDGHRMCMKLGADFWHMDHVAGFWMQGRDLDNTVSTNKPTQRGTKAYGITVAVNGRRYYMDYDAFWIAGLEGENYGSDLTRNVGVRHGHFQYGGEWPHSIHPSKGWYIFDAEGLAAGAIMESFSTDPVADNLVLVADTIEELAELIEVPVEELVETVQQWNDCCANGKDIFFHRPASTLTPIATPPFYAQLCVPEFLNTDGGPVRDAKARIIDVDGNVIPGLYSAGEFGSIWCNLYNGGGNLAEGVIFGRIAGKSALACE